MMMGIPDWDKGKHRAIEICREYGLDVRFFLEADVNNYLLKTITIDTLVLCLQEQMLTILHKC